METRCFTIAAIYTAFVMTGCASIITGTTQEVSFQSSPEGALVTVGGRVLGKTPITVQIDKESDPRLEFSKEGYETLVMPLATTIEPWFWGNIILGGLYGSTTDGISGAVYHYSPSHYYVTMTPFGPKIESFTLKSSRDKTKEFIVARHSALLAELPRGHGEQTNSLIQLLKIDKDKETDAINKLRGLSELFPDAPTFADQVLALYLK